MQNASKTLQVLLFFFFHLSVSSHSLLLSSPSSSADALNLLAFQSKADIHDKLRFSSHLRFSHCHWEGVKCARGKVVRLVLDGLGLGGVFEPNTLSRLDQLRVLSLKNNSLAGPVPDLSGLVKLKALFLDHNSFTGSFPPSILSLHRLRTLDLSYNGLTGPIPGELTDLGGIFYIRLEWNRFSGAIPPFNQPFLIVFNVSGNNLTGAVPVTRALSRFDESAFSDNPGLCGKIVRKECLPRLPFFKPSETAAAPQPQPPPPPPPPLVENGLNQQLQGVVVKPPHSPTNHQKTGLISGFSVVSLILIGSILSVLVAVKNRRKLQRVSMPTITKSASDSSFSPPPLPPVKVSEEEEHMRAKNSKEAVKSGSLVFCGGEAQIFSVEQLMSGSAELLGRGSIGSTYKAVLLDSKITVTVKRFDANKTEIRSREMFERHIVSVSRLRHPNLVPLWAYLQARDREERLLIYDFQPNGSVFSLVYGARSARAKPLHWTSCLKIAEEVAQGLAYIHQTVRLVHGNLKASNVLLGPDYEARLTDYCLTVFARTSDEENYYLDSDGYKAPEIQKSGTSSKSDVYAFGVLVLELLTCKRPSQQPFLMHMDLLNWVRHVRGEEGLEDKWLGMLVDIVIACSRASAEQRPTMWQVLKMIQEIKESAMVDVDSSRIFS